MPRTAFFSKEIIVEKALELVRSQGSEALSARNLSKALNCSISPLFTVFENMEEIRLAVKKAASDLFEEYVEDVTSYNPAFKEFGMRLVRFAKEDQNLFYMLFMERGTIGDEWIPKKVQEMCNIDDETKQYVSNYFSEIKVVYEDLAKTQQSFETNNIQLNTTQTNNLW